MGSKGRDLGEIILGLVLAGLCVVVITESLADYHSTYDPESLGPGFFPFWTAVLIIALSLVLVAAGLARRVREGARVPQDRSDPHPAADSTVQEPTARSETRSERLRLSVALLLATIYIALIPTLGFGAASFLLVFVGMRFERAPWWQSLVVACGAVVLGVVIRDYAFIQLPTGVVGL